MQIENMTIKTAKDIESLQGVNLGRFLGQLTGSTVTKIKDREAAVARAVEAFKAQGEKPVEFEAYIIEAKATTTKPARRATKVRKATKAKAVKKSNGERKARARKEFDFKPRKTIKEHRPGTKRAAVIELLKTGATFEQIMKKTGWDHRTAYEGTRLLNTHLGYGLTEKNGVIKIVKG